MTDKTRKELIDLSDEWMDSLTDEEWKALLKKHRHYGYDIGVNQDEIIQMYIDEHSIKLTTHQQIIDQFNVKEKYPNGRLISLENWIRNKLHEYEEMHDFAVATETVRCWIDEYKGII